MGATQTILSIDTALPETVIMIVRPDAAPFVRTGAAARRADDLLELIDHTLRAARRRLVDLKAIVVRRGLGSYTGLRVGVTVANTLAWSLNIPAVGIFSRRQQPLTPKAIARRIKNLESGIPASPAGGRNQESVRPVFPKYGAWRERRHSDKVKHKKHYA